MRACVLWAAAITATVLLVAACGVGPSPQPDATPGTLPSRPSSTTAPGPTEDYATDASLTLGLAGEPTNWNPLMASPADDPALSAVSDAVLPSAFTIGPGGSLVRNDALVGSAAVTSEAPETVAYEINPRAEWSDGVAVTGADFTYTWQAQSGQRRFRDRHGVAYSPASTAGYRQVESVTSSATDPDRVVVRFASPDPDWESLFDPLVPAHVSEAVGFDHGFTDPVADLVSAGPFLVQSYDPGRDVNLVRNPGWWGAAANLASIDITFVDSAGPATTGLLQGQLDAAVIDFSASTVATLRATRGLSVAVSSGPRYDDLVFDERTGPLSIRAARLALMTAVDRNGLVQQAHDAGDTGAAAVDNRVFAPGTADYRADTGVLPPGGPTSPFRRAEALLAAAGFTRAGAGLVHDGVAVRLSLAVGSTSPWAGAEVAAIVSAGRALGMDVRVDGSPAAPASPRVQHHDSMALVETGLTASPTALASVYGQHASLSGYSSLLMDGLLIRASTVIAPAQHAEILDQIDALAWHDAVDLPLLGVPTALAYQSRYTGLSGSSAVPGLSDDPGKWGIPQST